MSTTLSRPGRPSPRRSLGPRTLAAALALPFTLAACGAATPTGTGDAAPEDAATGTAAVPPAEAAEVAAAQPRLVVTHEGSLSVLDATTLELVHRIELDGYLRINDAGDGRHVLVSTAGGWQTLDVGTWAEPHGDHDHYRAGDPVLTDVLWPAETPAHVVVHDGRTALFDDGTGEVVVLDSADVADADAEQRTAAASSAHHGVAVERADGAMLITDGTEESRSTVRVIDADGEEVARTDDCPGVHGEASTAGAVVVGCEDGLVIWSADELRKVDSPDEYGRIGNQAGSEASSVVLGDYKSDPDAELERPTRVSLTDTATGELRLVDLPTSYTFRSLARGDDGEALVLGTDGALHVIDPGTGRLERSVSVVDEWEEPEDWQEPRPTLRTHAGTAYVTEPATSEIHAVDIETGEVFAAATLDAVPDEIVVTSGDAVDHAEHDDHDHEPGSTP